MKKLGILAFVVAMAAQPGCLVGEGCNAPQSWSSMADGSGKLRIFLNWVSDQSATNVIYSFQCTAKVTIEGTDPVTGEPYQRAIDSDGLWDTVGRPIMLTTRDIAKIPTPMVNPSMEMFDRLAANSAAQRFRNIIAAPDSTFTAALKAGESLAIMGEKCVQNYRHDPSDSLGTCPKATNDLGGDDPVTNPNPSPTCVPSPEKVCDGV